MSEPIKIGEFEQSITFDPNTSPWLIEQFSVLNGKDLCQAVREIEHLLLVLKTKIQTNKLTAFGNESEWLSNQIAGITDNNIMQVYEDTSSLLIAAKARAELQSRDEVYIEHKEAHYTPSFVYLTDIATYAEENNLDYTAVMKKLLSVAKDNGLNYDNSFKEMVLYNRPLPSMTFEFDDIDGLCVSSGVDETYFNHISVQSWLDWDKNIVEHTK
jgi:hypothetical protein